MEFLDTLHRRRSVRSFQDKEVPQDVLDKLLRVSLESPSSSNTQPYKVAVATGETCKSIGKALLDKFTKSNKINRQPLPQKIFNALTSDAMPDSDFKPLLGKYPGIFQERRVATGVGLYDVLGINRKDRQARDAQLAKNFTFFDAPAVMFIFVNPGMTHTALVDMGIWMQSFMLAATDAGLGTCAQGALGIWRSPLDNYFAIPKDYKLVCGMAIGYPTLDKVNAYRPDKIELSDLLIPIK